MLSVNIQFDYTYDSNHFFGTQASRATLQAAANEVVGALGNSLAAIAPGGGDTWSTDFFNPSNPAQGLTLSDPSVPTDTIVIYVGGSTLGGTELGLGGFGGYTRASGSAAWLDTVRTRGQSGTPAPFAPWGGSISFDDSPGTRWYFSTDPGGLRPDQADFLSIAEHEIGHVLGIGTSPRWSAQVSNGFFDGPAAEAAYGGPVPVDPGQGHFAGGTMSAGQVAVMTPVIPDGVRRHFTPLDYAALADLGWQVRARTATTTVPVPSTSAPVRGQAITLYAAVGGAPGAGAPTGTVTFMYGPAVVAAVPLLTADGKTYASLPTPPLGQGTYAFTTIYGGDASDLPSQGTVTFTVGPDATTTTVGPSDFTPVRGEAVAINAIVAIAPPGAGAPTGTVTFRSGPTVLATVPVLSANGLYYARLPAVPLGMGHYAITAVYNGDSGDAPGAGTTTFTVGPDVTTTIAGPSTISPVSGQPLSLNAIVAVGSPGAGTPTGTVTFRYGTRVVGIATLVTVNGLTYASLPLPALGPAIYTFTAAYDGDAGDLPSSASTAFTVSAAPARGASVALAIPETSRPGAPVPALASAPTAPYGSATRRAPAAGSRSARLAPSGSRC